MCVLFLVVETSDHGGPTEAVFWSPVASVGQKLEKDGGRRPFTEVGRSSSSIVSQ